MGVVKCTGMRMSVRAACFVAQARWERLMGRLCARLAWRKTRMLLHWLHNMLAFSGGTGGGRMGWLGEQVGRGMVQGHELDGGAAAGGWRYRGMGKRL